MSKGTRWCIVGAVVVWLLAALNGVLYVTEGDLAYLLAFFWCAAMAVWTTHSAMSVAVMDRRSR